MNAVSCPICSKPIRHWQPANIAKPGNVEERTLAELESKVITAMEMV